VEHVRAIAQTIPINAPPDAVWEAMVDVERWPVWAAYMKRLERQESGPLRRGSRVRVTPKGMPGSVWSVTEYDAGRSYTWTTRPAPGLILTGGHVVEAQGDGASATFSLAAAGPLGRALSLLLRLVSRRNTRLAAAGLKRYCERPSAAA
jgi:uncharacterized protein YndB with AHSA1/START domain